MLFPIEDPSEWAEKYDLPLTNYTCPKCKLEFMIDIPFAIKGYRGLTSAEHGCGRHYMASVAMPTSKQKMVLKGNWR